MVATLVALGFTTFFAVRVVQHVPDLESRADESIQPWMDVPYIAHSYNVPRDTLFQALGLPAKPPKKIAHQPIKKIASDQGRSIKEVESLLTSAINDAKQQETQASRPTTWLPTEQQLLTDLTQYELPLLFGITLISAFGAPLPATLLLIASGSFVKQNDLSLWWVLGAGLGGAVLGDLAGYGLGRWGAREQVTRLGRWVGSEAQLRRASAALKRRGGPGVFVSRFLLTPMGPTLNITSGMVSYPWRNFLMYDVAGEAIWVGVYVSLGLILSDRVQTINELFNNLVWLVVGLSLLVGLGWKLVRRLRSEPRRRVREKH